MCQWTLNDHTIYNKWMPQTELFPHNLPFVIKYNINLLTIYYTNYQHKYYKNIIDTHIIPYKTKTQDLYHLPKKYHTSKLS